MQKTRPETHSGKRVLLKREIKGMESTIIQNQKRIVQSINAQGNDYIFSHVDMQNLVWQGRLSKVKDPNYLDSRAAFVSLNHLVILYPETFFATNVFRYLRLWRSRKQLRLSANGMRDFLSSTSKGW